MNDTPIVVPATLADLSGWLALAREVEPLFGPMVADPQFHAGLERAILDGRAFCIRETAGMPALAGAPTLADEPTLVGAPTPVGGVLISRTHNEIGWLAVAARRRGRGCGSALLACALAHLDPTRPVTVTTFAASVAAGQPARRLYERFGFREHHAAEPTPAGVPAVVMVRPAEPEPHAG